MSLLTSLQTIDGIDEGKVFVENVRSAYNISRYDARLICEMAVQEGLFVKRIGVVCPGEKCNNRFIADFASYEEIPDELVCDLCESYDVEPSVYKTSSLKKVEFYQLK